MPFSGKPSLTSGAEWWCWPLVSIVPPAPLLGHSALPKLIRVNCLSLGLSLWGLLLSSESSESGIGPRQEHPAMLLRVRGREGQENIQGICTLINACSHEVNMHHIFLLWMTQKIPSGILFLFFRMAKCGWRCWLFPKDFPCQVRG